MKAGIVVCCTLLILLLLYIRHREPFVDLNYPSRFKSVIKEFRLGYNPSILFPKDMIPKDLRCDPILDCQQKVKDEDGTLVTLPPIRTKCLGDRVSICKPIKDVKSYPLNPSMNINKLKKIIK